MTISLSTIEQSRQNALRRAHALRSPGGTCISPETTQSLQRRAIDRMTVPSESLFPFVMGMVAGAFLLMSIGHLAIYLWGWPR